MDTLPNEILAEIFYRCLPDRIREPSVRSHNYVFSPTPAEAPLLLCSVCRLWREVTITIPSLWRSILVTIEPTSGTTRPPLDSIPLWFERSGNEPLWLALHDNSLRSSIERLPVVSSLVDQVLAIFSKHVARWRELEINLPNTPFSNQFSALPHSGAPLLQMADIKVNEPEDGSLDIGPYLSHLFQHSPALQFLSIDFPYSPDFFDTVHVHWASLVTLELQGGMLSAVAVAQVLSECVELVTLRVQEIGVENSLLPTTFTSITLPHLRSLYVYTWVELGGLFDKLTLPVLETLEVSFDPSTPRTWANTHVNSLITDRSGGRLARLELIDSQILEEDLIMLLRASPHLKELVLQSDVPCHSVQDNVLTMLVASVDGTSSITTSKSEVVSEVFDYVTYLCPCLETIVWVNCVYSSDGILSKMVSSRRPQAPATTPGETPPLPPYLQSFLRSIDIGFPSRLIQAHPEDRAALKTLRDDGLNVVLL